MPDSAATLTVVNVTERGTALVTIVGAFSHRLMAIGAFHLLLLLHEALCRLVAEGARGFQYLTSSYEIEDNGGQ